LDLLSTNVLNLSQKVGQYLKSPSNLGSGISGRREFELLITVGGANGVGTFRDIKFEFMYDISTASAPFGMRLSAIAFDSVISARTSAGRPDAYSLVLSRLTRKPKNHLVLKFKLSPQHIEVGHGN